MCAHTDGTDAGTAAAVRDAEGLVQVQVGDVAAEVTRLGQADESVEVGPVDVHLTAGVMHLGTDVGDMLLEDAVGGRVGDHEHSELVAVLRDLGSEVLDVDLAVVGGLHHDDLHPGHHGARGVGAVGGGRDQADGPALVAVGAVVRADGEQPRELTLRSGVRLEGDGVVAGDLREALLQLTDERQETLGLLGRCEGVQRAELGPGDRLHLGGRVQLHRAGAERDHAAVQRVVTVGELAQVAQHRGLGTVLVEDRVGQERVAAQQTLRHRVGGRGVQRLDVALGAESGPDCGDLRAGRGLVARERDQVAVDEPEVDPAVTGVGDHRGSLARDPDGERVEVGAGHHVDTGRTQPLGQNGRVAVGAPRDRPQSVGAVVHGVHTGHHGEQHLGGADVAGGLLAADVLLAGLQGQPVGLVPVRVHGDAHQAAGEAACELLTYGHEAGVRSAEAHRDAETLRGADRDVRAQVAGRGEQGEGEQIGGHGDDRAELVGLLDDGLDVAHGAGGARVLQQHAEDAPLRDLGRDAVAEVGDDDLDPGRLGAGLDDRDGLRQGVRVDQEDAVLDLADAPRQRHGLGGGGSLVEQGGAGGGQPGELGHHRLEVQEGFEAALGDLGLVRRVGRVPGGVLHHVAEDHRRGERAVVAEPDHRGQDLVAVGQEAQLGKDLGLGPGVRQLQGFGTLDHIGNRGGGQLVE